MKSFFPANLKGEESEFPEEKGKRFPHGPPNKRKRVQEWEKKEGNTSKCTKIGGKVGKGLEKRNKYILKKKEVFFFFWREKTEKEMKKEIKNKSDSFG